MPSAEVIAQRFAVERLAGSGGMGDVYAAIDRTTGERVALKRMRLRGADNFGRFNREAILLAELQHPAIVRYIAHGETAMGEPYLVMEWLSGKDLGALLVQRRLTIKETVILGTRVAEALGLAHARDVLHRDIKPSNVFLRDERAEEAILLDFGLARNFDASEVLTRTGAVVGTPGYMSPEQARGDQVLDARSDIFSLGCVLYHCLTGRSPFRAERLEVVVMKILHEEAPRVRDSCPNCPPELDALIARMLAKAPEARPPDLTSIAREMRELRIAEHGDVRSSAPPTVALTRDEQRLVCFIAAVGSGAAGDTSHSSFSVVPPTDEVMASLRDVAESHGARIELVIGSMVMFTVSGTGSATDLASRGARCALTMRTVLKEADIALAMGRGDASSPMPVGAAIERVLQLVGVGRDEGASTSSQSVRIDDTVAGLLDPRFEVREDAHGLVLVRFRDLVGSPRTLRGTVTPFVGREREIATLRAIFEECVGEPVARVALVTGPPGGGKSRVRHEFVRELVARDPPAEVWSAYGDSSSVGSPFGIVSQLVRRAASISNSDDDEVRRRKVRDRVASNPSLVDATRVAEFLCELIGAPCSENISVALRAARQDAPLMGEQIAQAWCDLLESESRVRPLVIVLDDLQWGDLASVRLLDAALRRLAERPLFVVAFARPGVHSVFPKMWLERDLQEIRLGALSRKAVERFVRATIGASIDDRQLETLVERAGGNPFFLEELIRVTSAGTSDTLPETMLAVVQARLTSLDPEARRVLRAASILRRFTVDDVRPLLGDSGNTTDVTRWLEHLVSIEMLERHSDHADGAILGFRSGVVCEAAYASLTEADRHLGHRLAAERLEATGRAAPGVVADHYQRSGDLGRAALGYARAAETALAACDLQSALELGKRGAACGAKGATLGRIRLVQLEALVWRADPGAAAVDDGELLSVLSIGSKGWCRASGYLAAHASQVGDLDRLLSIAGRLPGVEPDADAESAYVLALAMTSLVLYRFSNHEVAARLMTRLTHVAGRATADDPYLDGWVRLAQAYRSFGFADAWSQERLAREASAGFARAGDVRMADLSEAEAGAAHLALGEFERVAETMQLVLARADQRGIVVTKIFAARVLGLAFVYLGNARAAVEAASIAVKCGSEGSNRLHEAVARNALARAHVLDGALDAATREATIAMSLTAAPTVHTEAEAILAGIHLAGGNATEALGAAKRALDLLERCKAVGHVDVLVHLRHAESLYATGNRAFARVAIGRARTRLEEKAAAIPEERSRAMFLSRVPENVRALDLAREWASDAERP